MYLLYLFAWKIIGVLPEKSAYKLANLVSDQIFKKNGKGVKRLRSNYKRVMPNISERELEDLTKDGMRSYLRYWFDTFRLNKWSKSRIIETTFVVRENLLRDPIETKEGCIIALPHAGNWDHAAAYFCSTGIPLTAVVEKLKPEAIFKKFLAYRQSIGIEAISEPFESGALIRLANESQLMAYHHEGFWQPMDTLREKRALEEFARLIVPPWLEN